MLSPLGYLKILPPHPWGSSSCCLAAPLDFHISVSGTAMLCLQAQKIWVILDSSFSRAFRLLLYHKSRLVDSLSTVPFPTAAPLVTSYYPSPGWLQWVLMSSFRVPFMKPSQIYFPKACAWLLRSPAQESSEHSHIHLITSKFKTLQILNPNHFPNNLLNISCIFTLTQVRFQHLSLEYMDA